MMSSSTTPPGVLFASLRAGSTTLMTALAKTPAAASDAAIAGVAANDAATELVFELRDGKYVKGIDLASRSLMNQPSSSIDKSVLAPGSTAAVVFVVDISVLDEHSRAISTLVKILDHFDQDQHAVPVIVVSNKCDLLGGNSARACSSHEKLTEEIDEKCHGHRGATSFKMLDAVATTGQGVDAVREAIFHAVFENPARRTGAPGGSWCCLQ